MTYKIKGLSPQLFEEYFSKTDDALMALGIHTVIADDSKPGFPCRVSLQDAVPGDRLLLINYEHLPVQSPYRSSHGIYVSEGSRSAVEMINEVPKPLLERMLSIRAFDSNNMMIDADLVDGQQADSLINHFFNQPQVEFLHIHFAKRGCFAAGVSREPSD